MPSAIQALKAELEAMNLWDCLYVENPHPDGIDKDACLARIFRRVQLIAELHKLVSRN